MTAPTALARRSATQAHADRFPVATAELNLTRVQPVATTALLMKTAQPKYRRILLKLSGEALGGDSGAGISPEAVDNMAHEIQEVRELGVQVVVVIGGGNIFRGLPASEKGVERATADYMGMLATVINSLALQDALEKMNIALTDKQKTM